MMNNDLKPYLIAALIGIASPLVASASEEDSKAESAMEKTGDYISDAALTAKVKAALAVEDDLSAFKIDVDSNDGMVTLSGTLANDAQVALAEKVVEDVDGVKNVENNLETKR